ncbi:MAG TPA: signal peptidase I [Chloroflexota bacterium]
MTASDSELAAPAKKRTSFARELLETAVLTIAIFLVVRVALQNFRVEGQSMEPSLHNSEYILVNKIDYMVQSPQRGDVVVFRAVPAGRPDSDFIKRIIGVPGDLVAVHNGGVYVNGRRLREPYIAAPPDYTLPARRVPGGDYFVLGDNRNNSFDSSRWPSTWLPRSDIIGKAWIAYWPPQDLTWFRPPSY